MDEAKEIQKKIIKNGHRLLIIKQKHLGSDKLPSYIQGFEEFLENKNVIISDNSEVIDINSIKKDLHEITFKKNNKEYSPTTCCLVPNSINSIFTKKRCQF
jgi:uncharacterized FAD-dependent dehydrogenase